MFRCREDAQCRFGGLAGTCEPGAVCSFPDRGCRRGRRYGAYAPAARADRCVEIGSCGDGVLDPGEECDDGNRADNDGCSSGCVRCGAGDGDARMSWQGNGACYIRHDTPAFWRAARDACTAAGGHLATFASIYEDDAVRTALLPGVAVPVWIGMSDRDTEGALEWVTGEPVLVRHFKMPNGALDPLGEFDCVTYGPLRPAGPTAAVWRATWEVARCDEARAYICERPAWRVRPATRHAYRLVHSELNWANARAACAALGAGAHLATVTDAEEQAFIVASFFGPVWLGASDAAHEGDFRWITGEPFSYSHFAPNEPDNFDAKQHYLALTEEKVWHDRPGFETHRALCEVEPR